MISGLINCLSGSLRDDREEPPVLSSGRYNGRTELEIIVVTIDINVSVVFGVVMLELLKLGLQLV